VPKVDNIEPIVGKGHLGNASQFFVAGELCRRGHSAAVTLGNTPNVDVLCSNLKSTKFVHIQVKTFRPPAGRCMVGPKAEKYFGENFFWILVGLPTAHSDEKVSFFIIPSSIMSRNVKRHAKKYHATPGAGGQQVKKTQIRIVPIPPHKNKLGWSIERFRNRWELIDEALK
jgi:hypothetical protein